MSYVPAVNSAPYAPVGDATGARVRSLSNLVIVLLAARGGWPLLMRAFYLIARPTRSLHQVSDLVKVLLAITAIIFFLIWTYRLVSTIVARGERPRYSPGFAVGCWFIPFANFVMPALALTDAWRRIVRTGAGLVVGWWIAYLVFIVVDGFVGNPQVMWQLGVGRDVMYALGWLNTLVCVTVYGLWILMVHSFTKALAPRA